MTQREFVQGIKVAVYDTAVGGCLATIENPPGRHPEPQLLALSQWFKRLSAGDKSMVREAIELASRQSLFGLLAVLDGVRQIEESAAKGALELRFAKDGRTELLNDPSAEPLHDIFAELLS